MPQRVVKDISKGADTIPNPRGTLKPAEEGAFAHRRIEKAANVHLTSARIILVRVMADNAKEKPWGKKGWNAYRRLQMVAHSIEVGDWQDPRKIELDLSSDEKNLAMDIDPTLLGDEEADVNSMKRCTVNQRQRGDTRPR